VALDVVRAARKEQALGSLGTYCHQLHAKMKSSLNDASDFLEATDQARAKLMDVALHDEKEHEARRASSLLYHAISSLIMASEAVALGELGSTRADIKLELARNVHVHKLKARDPFSEDDFDHVGPCVTRDILKGVDGTWEAAE
jgi:hypothetical protein